MRRRSCHGGPHGGRANSRSDVTLLHYAEHLANIPNKRLARYRTPILRDGRTEWVAIEELDSSRGICDLPMVDDFERIVSGFLGEGRASSGRVGAAEAHLLDARELVHFSVEWMERMYQRYRK